MAYELSKKALSDLFLQGIPESFMKKLENLLRMYEEIPEIRENPIDLINHVVRKVDRNESVTEIEYQIDKIVRDVDHLKEMNFPEIFS